MRRRSSIEPGKLADLVVLDGDPLANIRALHKVKRVIKDGNVYDLEALVRPLARMALTVH